MSLWKRARVSLWVRANESARICEMGAAARTAFGVEDLCERSTLLLVQKSSGGKVAPSVRTADTDTRVAWFMLVRLALSSYVGQ